VTDFLLGSGHLRIRGFTHCDEKSKIHGRIKFRIQGVSSAQSLSIYYMAKCFDQQHASFFVLKLC